MSRSSSRRLLATLFALALSWALASPPAGATAQHAAGLVVDTGERVVTVYVEFEEETITGEELLRRADVDAVFAEYGSQGTAVCSILGVGSPKEDCFREAEQNGTYWNYSRAEGGDWQRSPRGVASTTVEHGDVDGWAWGPSGSEPPYYTFEEIRQQHAPASPSPSPTPTTSQSPSEGPQSPSEEPPPEPETSTEAPGLDAAAGDDGPDPATVSPSPTATAPTGEPSTSSPSARSSPAQDEAATPPGASPSPSSDRILATTEASSEAPYRNVGWLVFIVVMTGLVGAIAWRRRTGTADGGSER